MLIKSQKDYSFRSLILTALGPFGVSSTSKDTLSPSLSFLSANSPSREFS